MFDNYIFEWRKRHERCQEKGQGMNGKASSGEMSKPAIIKTYHQP